MFIVNRSAIYLDWFTSSGYLEQKTSFKQGLSRRRLKITFLIKSWSCSTPAKRAVNPCSKKPKAQNETQIFILIWKKTFLCIRNQFISEVIRIIYGSVECTDLDKERTVTEQTDIHRASLLERRSFLHNSFVLFQTNGLSKCKLTWLTVATVQINRALHTVYNDSYLAA